MKSQNQLPTKKKYDKPSLLLYGDIREVTQAVSDMSMTSDGGMGMMDKTQ